MTVARRSGDRWQSGDGGDQKPDRFAQFARNDGREGRWKIASRSVDCGITRLRSISRRQRQCVRNEDRYYQSITGRWKMEEDGKIPMLLGFYFGEAAEAARRGASERLLRVVPGLRRVAGGAEAQLPAGHGQAVGDGVAAAGAAEREDAVGADRAGYRAARGLDEGGGYSPATTGCAWGFSRTSTGGAAKGRSTRNARQGSTRPGRGEAPEGAALPGGEAAEPKGGDPAAEDDGAGPVGAGQAGLRVHAGAAAAGGAAGKAADN